MPYLSMHTGVLLRDVKSDFSKKAHTKKDAAEKEFCNRDAIWIW